MLMSKLSTDERNLLRYYAETARVLHGSGRDVVYQHLLSMGYIEERTVNMQDSVIVVTQAGRRALGFKSYAAFGLCTNDVDRAAPHLPPLTASLRKKSSRK